MSARLRILVDRDLCETNGMCVAKAPDVFEISEDDAMRVLAPCPAADRLDAVRAAVRACPKAALSLAEE
jgi:ferredoxin